MFSRNRLMGLAAIALPVIITVLAISLGGGNAKASGCAGTSAPTPTPGSTATQVGFAFDCFEPSLRNGVYYADVKYLVANPNASVGIRVHSEMALGSTPNGSMDVFIPAGSASYNTAVAAPTGGQTLNLTISSAAFDCAANCPPGDPVVGMGPITQAAVPGPPATTPVPTVTPMPPPPTVVPVPEPGCLAPVVTPVPVGPYPGPNMTVSFSASCATEEEGAVIQLSSDAPSGGVSVEIGNAPSSAAAQVQSAGSQTIQIPAGQRSFHLTMAAGTTITISSATRADGGEISVVQPSTLNLVEAVKVHLPIVKR